MSDLKPVSSSNFLFKYADDCYLVTPGKKSHTITKEIDHLNNWCKQNNLKLNVDKTKELIVSKKNCNLSIIPKIGLERVEVLRVLGIFIDKHLNFTFHVDYIVSKASQSLYAIKKLQNHGLKGKELEVVYRSLVLSKISYASQAWWGFANKENIIKLDNCVKKAVRWGIIGNKIFQDFQQSFKLYDSTF